MKLKEITDLIEKVAPLETQELWDCSGYQIAFSQPDINIKKIILALSVTQKIIEQAEKSSCDLIIAHHPLFFIPFSFNKNIPIYSAHTNLDKADGGTTDTLITVLGLNEACEVQKIGNFLRLIELKNERLLVDFINLVKEKLNIHSLRVVNNYNKEKIKKIAFCAGSGSDFLKDAEQMDVDVLVTGDVKYHTAIDSNVIIIDAGHFESERPVLKTIKDLLGKFDLEVIEADEKVLLLIISLFLSQAAYAYQTVLVDFPDDQGWHSVYYKTIINESLLQYVPDSQTAQNWTRTVIFHSYNSPASSNSAQFMDRTTMQMENQNSTQAYKYIKYTDADSIATRCITKNSRMPTQCEIYRVSKSFEGLITMHYINKNVQNFKATYSEWFQIMKSIRIYYSYYMDDRVLDKATSFQL